MYKAQAVDAGAGETPGTASADEETSSKPRGDDVEDADYEVVDEEK